MLSRHERVKGRFDGFFFRRSCHHASTHKPPGEGVCLLLLPGLLARFLVVSVKESRLVLDSQEKDKSDQPALSATCGQRWPIPEKEGKVGQSQFESYLRGLLPEHEETQGQGSMTISTWDFIFILLMWACTSSSAGMSQFLPWEAWLTSYDPLSLPSPTASLHQRLSAKWSGERRRLLSCWLS